MSNEEFQESGAVLHPINFASYTLDTIPATDVTLAEAEFWADELRQTHRLEGSVLPIPGALGSDSNMTVGQLLALTEGTQRNRILSGKTVVGPVVLGGVIMVEGIGLWAPLEDSPAEA